MANKKKKPTIDLAPIKYVGVPGSGNDGEVAISRLIAAGRKPFRARILTSGGSHRLLMQVETGAYFAVKSGFRSDVSDSASKRFSRVLKLLEANNCELSESECPMTVIYRLDHSALTRADLDRILNVHPIAPERLYCYTHI